MEVHKRLGHGFLDLVYQEVLAIAFVHAGIPVRRECDLSISYRGRPLRCAYGTDFKCSDGVLVELKALSRVGDVERAQVMNDLKATGLVRRLVLNLGRSSLELFRVISSPNLKTSAESAEPAASLGDAHEA